MGTIWTHRSGLGAYAIAGVLSLVALALHWALAPWMGPRVPFLFFLPTLVLTAAVAGRGPAALVTLVGGLNALVSMEPVGTLTLANSEEWVALAVYAAVAAGLVMLGSELRVTSHRAAEAEYRLRLAQDNTGIGLFDIDFISKTVFASAGMTHLMGHAPVPGRMSLTQWVAMLPEEEVVSGSRQLRKKLAEGVEAYEREHRVVLPDGRERWLMSRVHIERRTDGRVARLRGASVDITQRKENDVLLRRTQEELQQKVADLHQLHDIGSRLLELPTLADQVKLILQAVCGVHGTARGLVWLLDPDDGRLTIEASTGFSSQTLSELQQMPPGAGPCSVSCIESRRVIVEDVDVDERFNRYRDLAHRENLRAVHSTPLFGLSGQVLGALSVYFDTPRRPTRREVSLADIYARKAAVFIERSRAAQRAAATEHRLKVALESSGVPFAMLNAMRDPRGQIIDFRWDYVNAAATRALNRSASELAGRRLLDAAFRTWNETTLFETYVDAVEQREMRELFVQVDPDVWFRVIASPFDDSVAVWFADVTERKRQEQALQEADRRKDEFLATLAHELRNPLAPIRQAALISKMPNATDDQKRWSQEVIDRQVQHMAWLLDDLLDVSRITRGMLQLRKTVTELASVVDAAVETARPLIDVKRHQLIVDMPPEPVHIEADPLRLAQVVANLLTNAAKYTDPEGAIRLTARRVGNDMLIDVADNGIGLRPELLDEIFNMFTQVRPADDRSSGGLGIGLALARGLVRLHGGTITAASEGPGLGSRFSVRLPGAVVQAQASAPVEPARHRSSCVHRVLLADDNRDGADSLAALLRLAGHEVDVVYDGEAALAEFDRIQPDVVLLDVGMPKRSGYEVAAAIRARADGHAPMLVAITGWGQMKDRSTAIAAGFDHHMTKPVDPDRLQDLLAGHTAAQAGAAVS